MARLKVLLTVHQFFPRWYHGTERYTLDLATELSRAGHEIVVLTANHAPEDSTGEDIIEYDYTGIRVRAIDLIQNSRPEFSASYHRPDLNDLFARILLEERPDVVHCAHLLFLGVSFLDIVRYTDCPILFTMTDFFGICWTNKLLTCGGKECAGPDRNDNNCVSDVLGSLSISHPGPAIRFGGRLVQRMPLLTPLIETILKTPRFQKTWYASLIDGIRKRRGTIEKSYRSVDHFIVATAVLEKKYREYGLNDRLISRLPFGITQPTEDEVRLLRSRYGELRSTDRPLIVGFVGQIARHKGVDLLLRAFVNVCPANTELHVVGNLEQDPAFANELRRIRAHREVSFLPPFPTTEVYKILGKIDVLVLPSIWSENAPLILLNSLASRTFVAVSDVAGMTEFVRPEETGLVFAAKSIQAIEEMLIRVATLRPMLLDLFDSHPGYQVSPSTYADQIAKLYGQHLESGSRFWNEAKLKEIARSSYTRTRPVKWRCGESEEVRGSGDNAFDLEAATVHQLAVDRMSEGRFMLKTLSADSFLLLNNDSAGKAGWIELLAKWPSSMTSVVYYSEGQERPFSEDQKAVIGVVKEKWIRIRFDLCAAEFKTRVFRWHLAPSAAGVEVEIRINS
jgi:glycosyltransferase involved in cell wall biosynthesis